VPQQFFDFGAGRLDEASGSGIRGSGVDGKWEEWTKGERSSSPFPRVPVSTSSLSDGVCSKLGLICPIPGHLACVFNNLVGLIFVNNVSFVPS